MIDAGADVNGRLADGTTALLAAAFSGQGAVVNVSSVVGHTGNAGQVPYAMAKAGLDNVAGPIGKFGIVVVLGLAVLGGCRTCIDPEVPRNYLCTGDGGAAERG